jgi:hypothetical protein
VPLSDRQAAALARLVDEASGLFELSGEERLLFRETVAASTYDLTGSDGWFWMGPTHAWGYLEDLAERIAGGEGPRSYLDYEEARADAACG